MKLICVLYIQKKEKEKKQKKKKTYNDKKELEFFIALDEHTYAKCLRL